MTSDECLKMAMRLEVLAQELYRGLADRYADRADLRELFTALSEEECLHAARIRELAGRPGDDLDPATGARIGGLLRDLEAELQSLSEVATRDGERPEDILLRVVRFETRFAEVHAEHLAEALAPESRLLFLSLAHQDRHHKEMVEQLLSL